MAAMGTPIISSTSHRSLELGRPYARSHGTEKIVSSPTRVYLEDESLTGAMFEEMVGSSEPLLRTLKEIAIVAPTDSTVLITGETGTGKELVARAIHKRSRRANRPFVRVNCAALPASLIASELFGHERGAFTSANERRVGRFELANSATIFLDEIGDIPAEMQVSLLRVLQEREIERVGSSRAIPIDVRIITATNRDLKAAVDAGAFRLDLFYRLDVFPVHVPSLRERGEDIPLLTKYFVEHYANTIGKRIRTIEKSTLQALQGYAWPGNVRELQNVIERAVIWCDQERFSVDENWVQFRPPSAAPGRAVALAEILASDEKQIIEAALEESRGRISGPLGAARKLGIPRSTLESTIKTLHINRHTYKLKTYEQPQAPLEAPQTGEESLFASTKRPRNNCYVRSRRTAEFYQSGMDFKSQGS